MTEIGSDYETVASRWLRSEGVQARPWLRSSDNPQYFESGRQSIAALSRHLRGQGATELYFPTHYCESMLAPFLGDGWRVHLVPVLDDWTLDPGPLLHAVSMASSLVFTLSYFGVPESPEWMLALSRAADQGAHVVSDETHRIWEPGPVVATYRFASLRKLLPLPDGAFLTGDVPQAGGHASSSGSLRLEGMRAKTAHLRAGGERGYRQAFVQAERLLEDAVQPRAAHAVSMKILDHLDYTRMAGRRAANHRTLEDEWPCAQLRITTGGAAVPAFCVVEGRSVARLRRHLIDHQVYPPVHWEPPGPGFPQPRAWRDGVLSIPVDHRYDDADMCRILEIVDQFERQ